MSVMIEVFRFPYNVWIVGLVVLSARRWMWNRYPSLRSIGTHVVFLVAVHTAIWLAVLLSFTREIRIELIVISAALTTLQFGRQRWSEVPKEQLFAASLVAVLALVSAALFLASE